MGKLARSKISERLIGMGDSHLDNFSFFCAATCRIPEATAHGLVNDNSVTRSREAFKSFLSAFPSYIPLLCLGEVDCNSLPWYMPEDDPKEVIHQAVNNLSIFLKETDRKFILSSVTLPPIDSYQSSEVRLHVTADKKERTSLVKLYNKLLKDISIKSGHHYLDLTTPTTGKDGFVDKSYIRSLSDVHLSSDKVRTIVRSLLDEVAL